MLQNEYLLLEIGFDTAENGPSKVWVTGILVYRYTDIPVYRYRHRLYRYILR